MTASVAKWGIILVVAAWVGALAPARAQAPADEPPPPLVTDRPDFTVSAAVVPESDVQIEMGAEYAHTATDESLDLPLALVRYGLGGGFELRLGLPSVQFRWADQAAAATDLSPVELGAKFVTALSARASIGLLPFLSLPLKGEQYSSLGVDLRFKFVWSVELTDWLGLGGNLGLIFTGLGAGQTGREYQASLSFGFGLSDSWGLFVEGFTRIAESQLDAAPVCLDAGLTWRVAPLVQLDVYAGLDLRAAPEAVFAGLGVSHRW